MFKDFKNKWYWRLFIVLYILVSTWLVIIIAYEVHYETGTYSREQKNKLEERYNRTKEFMNFPTQLSIHKIITTDILKSEVDKLTYFESLG